MFMLYALPLGLVAGLAAGGRIRNLGAVQLRWMPAVLLSLLLQVVLFSTPMGETEAALRLGPPLYVASMALLLAAILANLPGWGPALLAFGCAGNLAVIAANAGRMPVSADALRQLHGDAAVSALASGGPFTNVVLMGEHTVLWWLGDVFALPAFVPFGNVFSAGDVLGALGAAVWVAQLMSCKQSGRSSNEVGSGACDLTAERQGSVVPTTR
jgi:hypothetical protein